MLEASFIFRNPRIKKDAFLHLDGETRRALMYLISKKLARGGRKFYNSKQLRYVQRLLEIGEELLQILAGHSHFIAGILDCAVLEFDEFGQLVQR